MGGTAGAEKGATVAQETTTELRFAFGKNWQRFLSSLGERQIRASEASLSDMLGLPSLAGTTFLDVGCGSGLASLAACRLGARVLSFDCDQESVHATLALKARFLPHSNQWEVRRGSVLDQEFLSTLGRWDIVYAWGVLHHTGDLYQGMANVVPLVAPGGTLFLAIYNDQGYRSRLWAWAKKTYVTRPWTRPFLVAFNLVRAWGLTSLIDALTGKPFRSWREYGNARGMSPWWDVIDWIGGWPFEVATPEAVFTFYRQRGFLLERLVTSQGIGCNQFVFSLPRQS